MLCQRLNKVQSSFSWRAGHVVRSSASWHWRMLTTRHRYASRLGAQLSSRRHSVVHALMCSRQHSVDLDSHLSICRRSIIDGEFVVVPHLYAVANSQSRDQSLCLTLPYLTFEADRAYRLSSDEVVYWFSPVSIHDETEAKTPLGKLLMSPQAPIKELCS